MKSLSSTECRSERRIRILFAIPELGYGGPDRVFFELLRAIDRTRFKPMLTVTRNEGRRLAELPDDVDVFSLTPPNARLLQRYPVVPLIRLLRQVKPDVVLSTLRMNLTAYCARAFVGRSIRFILRQPNHYSADVEWLKRSGSWRHRIAGALNSRAFRSADLIICQNAEMESDLKAMLGATIRTVVIGNPIDVGFVVAQAKSDVEMAGNPRIVSMGRLSYQKGYDVLLRAMPAVVARFPQVQLTIFGDGPDRTILATSARDLGIERNVTLAGISTNPYPALRATDIYVCASRYEGFSNALLEALACGAPVVSTRCPGTPYHLLHEGKTGWLAEVDDADDLARAILKGLSQRAEFDPDRSIELCRRFHAPRVIAEQYEDAIISVVSSG